MSRTNKSDNEQSKDLDRTEILRAVMAHAESMGLRDREKIEQLTNQVIERLEKPQTLPGMEDMVSKTRRRSAHALTKAEIQAMVQEVLSKEEAKEEFREEPRVEPFPPVIKPIINKEVKPMAESTIQPKPSDRDFSPSPVDSTSSPPVARSGGEPQEVQLAGNLKLTQNAIQVLEKRYLKRDKQGKPLETPETMFRRVAQAIAMAEILYDSGANIKAIEEEFYQTMISLEFLPNSPTLMNAGRELGQLSACFVLPVEDSMESIFDAVKNTALIHKSGGGTGFSFSRLRPETDRVGSTGGVASGPVSFMRAFDTATDVIKQGGMRRGANMAILNVDHPDIMRFITAKEDPKALTNFNLSVAVTSTFMEAVKAGADYDLINPHTKEAQGKANAREIFDKIVSDAWRTGDPGVVFIDRINQDNPTPHLGRIESTNPCGEQPLLPYESCNLGSINLSIMVRRNNGVMEVDYPRLARVVKTAVRFLDDVIDVNKFPLPEIEAMTKKSRKIGLGVMGFADMLIELGIAYNSEAGVRVATEVMRFITEEGIKASTALAVERGVFPCFKGSTWDASGKTRVRNAACTTIAPTGTLSIIASVSSGIEPLFALCYTKNVLDGAHLVEVNRSFEEAARKGGFYSEELMQKLASGTRLHDIENIPEEVKSVFVTAHDISPEWHVRMQAAFQKSTHNAVSKTVNFPHEATKEDVAKVYTMAHELGLKGITIYRDGSRDAQVLTTGTEKKAEASAPTGATGLTPRKRAKVTTGITEMVNTGCGHLYVTINSDEKGVFEVFSALGKAGGCAAAQLESTCRLISLSLRAGVDVTSIVKQLRGIRCPSIAWEQGKAVLSCADAIASVLEHQVMAAENKPATQGGKGKSADYGLAKNLAGQCPDCGGLLVYEEGCFKCPGCGYTKC